MMAATCDVLRGATDDTLDEPPFDDPAFELEGR